MEVRLHWTKTEIKLVKPIYEPNLGSGNTAVEVIDCGQTMPDGRVQWTEGQTMEASGTYVPWETDYSVSGNPEDGYLSVDYSFYASDGTPCTGSTLTVCLLDTSSAVSIILAFVKHYVRVGNRQIV